MKISSNINAPVIYPRIILAGMRTEGSLVSKFGLDIAVQGT